MTLDSELVRLSLALAHAMPDGGIELTLNDRSVLRAEHGGALTPCDLRISAIARACPLWSGASARITDVRIKGEYVEDLGLGVYGRTGSGNRHERWFATVLAPSTVTDLLAHCPLEFPIAIDASLRPDPELGVTIAVITSDGTDDRSLDDATRWAAHECYLRELFDGLHAS